MVGMRELALSAAKHSFDVKCEWIATKENVFADSASRADKDGWGVFFGHCKELLGLEPEQLKQVTPSLDTRVVLEKIRRSHLARERADGVEDVGSARESRGARGRGGRARNARDVQGDHRAQMAHGGVARA